MKLSALIREAATRPWRHGKGHLVGYDRASPHAELSVCALGGAFLVAHADIYPTPEAYWEEDSGHQVYPITGLEQEIGFDLTEPIVLNPITKQRESLWDCITQLNDLYDWSFTQIADYLEKHGY